MTEKKTWKGGPKKSYRRLAVWTTAHQRLRELASIWDVKLLDAMERMTLEVLTAERAKRGGPR